MELTKKQKILLAVAFFALIFLTVLFFMISSYDRMEDDGEMMSAEQIAFYQQTKESIIDQYESLAASHNWQYKSLTSRYHSSSSQYNPQFIISEGEQQCGRVAIEQNINYVTAESAMTCNTQIYCSASGWEETIQLLLEHVPVLAEIHNLYGKSQLTEEMLSEYISGSLPAEPPVDDSSRPDPNDKSQLILQARYYPDDDSNYDPHYKIFVLISDYLDESKLT